MNKVELTSTEEPNEKELDLLMHEVAVEAQIKAAITKIILAEKIKLLIQNINIQNG